MYLAHSSAIANNSLYIGGEKGVYKTSDGVTWTQEKLPYPQESNPNNFENSFYSMAEGNNKLITETNWWQNKQRRGLIYTKDLITNQWSYEVYLLPVTNITRGKDRFVAMTESSALVLIDGKNDYIDTPVTQSEFSSLSYGLNGKFIGTNPIMLSTDGLKWLIGKNFGGGNIACNDEICITVGHEYHVAGSIDGKNWEFFEFNNKNPKPHWWRRFINF